MCNDQAVRYTSSIMGEPRYAVRVEDLPDDSELDDASLARRIAAAHPATDAGAETELYRRLAPRVRLYGLKHLRDPHAAADLVQQVLLVTLQQLRAGRLREPERLASFIFGTCRMVVLDLRRTRSRRERLLRTYEADVPTGGPGGEPGPDEARLLGCLERLPERERSVLVLSFFDEQPAQQVATALSLSEGNVRVIRHRALQRLRGCMDAGEAGP
jgi:RNA polymerase sigma-70 factor, ECF subfamily